MRYPSILDYIDVTPTTGVAVTSAQTVTARIKQEPSRLEAIYLAVTLPATGVATTATANYLAGLIKEVRLKVNDVLGPRYAVQAKGPALISFAQQNGISRDRNGWALASAVAAFTPAVVPAMTVGILIPLRHPLFGEPYGNLLSVPLNQLREDAILEIDLGVAADVGTGATLTGNLSIRAYTLLRKAPLDLPYIPSELRTDAVTWGAAGKGTYEFASSGYLTQVMLSNFTSTVARGPALTAGGYYQFDYGRTTIRRADDAGMQIINDGSMDGIVPSGALPGIASLLAPVPTTATPGLSVVNMPNEIMFDFLTDQPWSDAFSVGSVLDLNPSALNGDKARLTINDVGAANRITWFTQHRLLNQNRDDLKMLSMGL